MAPWEAIGKRSRDSRNLDHAGDESAVAIGRVGCGDSGSSAAIQETDVWFDNQGGDWVVDATPDSESQIGDVLASYGLADWFRVNTVSYGHKTLVRNASLLDDDLSAYSKQGLALATYSKGQIEVVAYTQGMTARDKTDIDEIVSSFKADIPIATRTVDESLKAQEGTVYCSFPWCTSVISGAQYQGPLGGSSTFLCTMAFYGRLIVSGATIPMFYTANHCTQAMGGAGTQVFAQPFGSNTLMGASYNGEYGGDGGDWGWVRLTAPTPSGFGPSFGGWQNWNNNTQVATAYVYGSRPAVGTTICHSGVGLGNHYGAGASTQCGTVTSSNIPVTIGSTTLNLVAVNAYSCVGDSGGPFWEPTSNTAAGMFSSLGSALAGGQCDYNSYFSPISRSFSTYAAYSPALYAG